MAKRFWRAGWRRHATALPLVTAALAVFLLVRQNRRICHVCPCFPACGLQSAAPVLRSFGFVLGGAVLLWLLRAIPGLLSGGVFYLEPPRPGMLLGGVILAFIILPGIWRFGERRRRRKADSYRLTVCDADRCVQVQAVVDTGNQLRDPLTGRPLCVASYHALRRLLPEVLCAAFDGDGDPVLALERLDIDRATQFGVAPFVPWKTAAFW